MVRMRFENEESPLRDKIFKVLSESKTKLEEDLAALLQCASHIKNRKLVETMAKECGLKLPRFLTNDQLELYYDIKHGRHDLGYISKGWDDPGFRIGDLIIVPKSKAAAFREHAYEIMRYCAVNGIGITVKEIDGAIEVSMDGVIYSEGFNKDTFKKTLETLNECVEKLCDFIEA